MDTSLDALMARAHTYTAFADHQRHLATAPDLAAVVEAARRAIAAGAAAAVTVFNDATGDRTEIEPNATAAAVRARLEPATDGERRGGPGRPKLGVVSREVSLLPRHWDWLAAQPGGASAALRRLIDDARKRTRAADAARAARDAAYKAMTVLGGDLPGFEEATRTLYASDFARACALVAGWPDGRGAHLAALIGTAAALHELAANAAEEGGSHG